MERKSEPINCIDCPENPGRFCVPYIGGQDRLVFNPLPAPEGLRKYYEGYKSPGSISACPVRQTTTKDNNMKLM